MPSIIGNVKVVELEAGFLFGDAIQLSPQSLSNTSAGAGSFITGDVANTNNAVSTANIKDPDVSDSNQKAIGNSGVV